MMNVRRVGVVVGIALLALSSVSFAGVSYSGSMSSAVGMDVTGEKWLDPGLMLSWTITDTGLDYTWHYKYEFSNTHGKNISHFILETSPNFSEDDIFNVKVGGEEFSDYNIDTWSGPSNPGMPEAVYGVKFNSSGPSYEFDTHRLPVWGDFYIKDGGGYRAFDKGFVSPDTDPSDPPANGSLQNHILRPDSVAPGLPAIALVGIAPVVGAWIHKRKR
jgi:hypothetical protein